METEEIIPLKTGDTAPELTDTDWVKGDHRKIGEGYTIVEFWATWCGPCRQTIPHLTELQKQYKGKLYIIGLSNEDRPTVQPFVEEQGADMDYTVGCASDEVYSRYMAEVEGIPHCYLVNKAGKILWSGHPMEIDPILESLLVKKVSEKNIMAIQMEKEDFMKTLYAIQADNSEKNKKLLFKQAEKILKRNPADMQTIQTFTYVASAYYGNEALEAACDMVDVSNFTPDDFRALIEQFILSVPKEVRPVIHSVKWMKAGLKKHRKNADILVAYSKLLTELCCYDEAVKAVNEALAANPEVYDGETYLNYLNSLQKARKLV